METDIHRRVLQTIERHSMILPGERLGLGVSGGADSVALLRLFCDLRSRLGVSIVVLHFHHQLRGADADADEAFVQALAQEHSLDFIPGRADVAGEAQRNGWNLEDAARRLRYQFFASVGAARQLNRVAVAHTADDQAETVLAHLLRGTGPRGLAGIHPIADLVIRPLLEIRREDLRGYLRELNQPWREDESNRDTSRMRARIRHKLLPALERDFEPAVVGRLARLAELSREEELFWRGLEEDRFAALTSRDDSRRVSIEVADLLSPLSCFDSNRAFTGLPALAVTRRLIRRIYSEIHGSRQQITARHVEDVLHLAAKGHSGARLELPGVTVNREFNRLVFVEGLQPDSSRTDPKATKLDAGPQFEYAIAKPTHTESTDIVLPEIQRRFSLKMVDWPSRASESIMEQSTLDFDSLRWPLVLRNWRPGDAYRPHRRHRVRKLKRLLLESRIPFRDRPGWPVLTSAGALVWSLRCPVADPFAPRSGTRTGLVIVEEAF